MKKLLLLIVLLVSVGCSNNEIIDDNVYTLPENNPKEELGYVDDNPIEIGLYIKNSETRYMVTNYKNNWTKLKDINCFTTFYTSTPNISRDKLKTVWKNYYNKYTNISNYKIGYHIHFELTSGEIIDQNILSPKDNNFKYYLMTFLYDDINSTGYYTHLEEDDIKDNTIITSIKLTSGNGINYVIEPIILSAFTYNSEDDFDPDTKLYRGNSQTTTRIYRK